MPEAFQWFRYAVLAVCGALALGGLAAMAVQRRTISPFSAAARGIRRLTDPMVQPLERRLIRSGRNPQSAPAWLIGIALIGGILLVTFVQWVAGEYLTLRVAGRLGGGAPAAVLVNLAFNVLMVSLLVRVIGSWFGAGRYTRWMRPFVWLTEWMLAPLRRIVPAFGPLDVTPIVAYLLLMVVRSIVMRML